MTTDRLERGYRRLLACYPAAHRAVYGDEMLGVLMSVSTPGQRRPGAREALNLLGHGLRQRLRATLPEIRVPVWRDAFGVFGYLASVLVAVVSAAPVVGALSWRGPSTPPSRSGAALAVGWILVAAAAGLGWRRIAAAGATVGVVGQAIVLALAYAWDPGRLVTSWWLLVLATAAAASLVLRWQPAPEPESDPEPESGLAPAVRIRPRPLGARSTIAVAVAAALGCVAPLGEARAATVVRLDEWTFTESPVVSLRPLALPMIGDRPFILAAALVLLVTYATVLLRLRPLIRRRVLVLAAPAAAVALVVAWTFNGFLVSTARFSPPVLLVTPQWTVLAATPVFTFALGAWMVARFERKVASGALLR